MFGWFKRRRQARRRRQERQVDVLAMLVEAHGRELEALTRHINEMQAWRQGAAMRMDAQGKRIGRLEYPAPAPEPQSEWLKRHGVAAVARGMRNALAPEPKGGE